MSATLRAKVDSLRADLDTNPDALLIGDLPSGVSEPGTPPNFLTPSFSELLKIANGAQCGEIGVCSDADIERQQFFGTDLPGGPERWLTIGLSLDVPIFQDRGTEEVWWAREYFGEGEPGELERLSPDALAFLDHYAMGPGYAELTGDTDGDEWFELLREHGYA